MAAHVALERPAEDKDETARARLGALAVITALVCAFLEGLILYPCLTLPQRSHGVRVQGCFLSLEKTCWL